MEEGLIPILENHAKDDLVKNVISDFPAENFEIASYNTLIAASQLLSDEKTAAVCRDILAEEENMRDFLKEHSDEIVPAAMVDGS